MPSSTVICSLVEACAFVIVLACKPCSASTVVQLIAELKAVLCASAIAWRLSFIFRYYVSSHFVMQHARCCCMKRSTFALDRGLCPQLWSAWYRRIDSSRCGRDRPRILWLRHWRIIRELVLSSYQEETLEKKVLFSCLFKGSRQMLSSDFSCLKRFAYALQIVLISLIILGQ